MDQLHVLVLTKWRWDFGDKGDVALPATLILRRNAGAWSIVFYLNHYDISAVLRERGLLPPATV